MALRQSVMLLTDVSILRTVHEQNVSLDPGKLDIQR